MKSLRDYMILWTPTTWDILHPETRGQVKLVKHPDLTGIHRQYAQSAGACDADVRGWSSQERAQFVLAMALAMIVRDGLSPDVVHKALWELEEYREHTPVDMPRVI